MADRFFEERKAKADFKAFDKIMKRRGGGKLPAKATNCVRRSILAAAGILAGWTRLKRTRGEDSPSV
jgi:hypothetical protein